MENFRLDGKVAIVTGAGTGLGYGTAVRLARAGADVVVTSRTVGALGAVTAHLGGVGVGGMVAQVAALRSEARQQITEAVVSIMRGGGGR